MVYINVIYTTAIMTTAVTIATVAMRTVTIKTVTISHLSKPHLRSVLVLYAHELVYELKTLVIGPPRQQFLFCLSLVVLQLLCLPSEVAPQVLQLPLRFVHCRPGKFRYTYNSYHLYLKSYLLKILLDQETK